MDDAAGRAGVAWTRSAGAPAVESLLENLRGRVEAGIIEALEGGILANGEGSACCFSAANASLYLLLAGVAFTWTAPARFGFFSSVQAG